MPQTPGKVRPGRTDRHRSRTVWYHLPGKMAEQTLARDAQEEGGLQVDGLQRIGEAWECVYAVEEDRYYCKLGVFFSGMGIEQFEDQEDDHQLIWLSLEQAFTFLIHGSQRWAVRSLLRD